MPDPVMSRGYQSGSEGSDHHYNDDEPERNFSSFGKLTMFYLVVMCCAVYVCTLDVVRWEPRSQDELKSKQCAQKKPTHRHMDPFLTTPFSFLFIHYDHQLAEYIDHSKHDPEKVVEVSPNGRYAKVQSSV